MSCLDATFTLTPRSPWYSKPSAFIAAPADSARLYCFGADYRSNAPTDLSSLYASDRFYFNQPFASDPNLDYTQWGNRKKARYIEAFIRLSSYYTLQKQLALIFGFEVENPNDEGRVLVYTDAGLLRDLKLVARDSQFLLELESLDQALTLYFIHAGGSWFFKGLSGYVV